MIHRFRLALAFLTRLPGGRHPSDGNEIASSVALFPLVGLVVGALGAAVGVGTAQFLPALTAATLAFMFTALATGGFHEDGLADSFDGLAGGWTVEQRLEILKDSRHGTFGVLSILLVTLVKVSAFAAVLDAASWWRAVLVLVAVHGGARGAAVALMGNARTASPTGLGADYTRMLGRTPAMIGGLLGGLAVVAAFWWWAPIALVALTATTVAIGWWSYRKIGGITGDLLGAAEQAGECALLCTAAAVL